MSDIKTLRFDDSMSSFSAGDVYKIGGDTVYIRINVWKYIEIYLGMETK